MQPRRYTVYMKALQLVGVRGSGGVLRLVGQHISGLHRGLLVALLAVVVLAQVGCKPRQSALDTAFVTAGAGAPGAGGGRGAAGNELVAAIDSKAITFDEALAFANTKLDEVGKGTANSAAATAFAGAVLDVAARIEDRFPHQGEFELFWINVGRLAFRAAEEAHANERIQEGMTLVFAGPQRWQNQAYWERYSDHDGLAAILLAKSGQVPAAIERLQSRADLRGVALDVYEALTKRKE